MTVPTISVLPTNASWEDAVRWLREQPGNEELVLAAYYDDPLTEAATRYWQSAEWADVRGHLPGARGTALDIGAGRGIASFALAREGFAVTALEPDASDLVGAGAIRALAREAGLPITVNQEFAEGLPFPDGSFDIVFARAAMHHTRDLPAACREVFRVLKPGGRLLGLREHVITSRADLPAFLGRHPLHKYYGGENAFLVAEYEAAIRSAGFRQLTTLGPFDSAINLAPRTVDSIQTELALRASFGLPGVGRLLRTVIAAPPIWRATRSVLRRLDNRPGRLYSFVATKAA